MLGNRAITGAIERLMREPIKVQTIKGMNNVFPGYDPEEPDFILNLDAFTNKLAIRDGYSKIASFTTCHSLASFGEFLLCVGNGSSAQNLFKIDLNGLKTELGSITGIDKLYYVSVDNDIFMSSKHWTKKLNKTSGVMSSWGISIPVNAPNAVSSPGGDLPGGLYAICFTTKSGDQRSGQGPITYIQVEDGDFLEITNLGANEEVWISSQGDPEFYYFRALNKIFSALGTTHLKSLDVIPPPNMQHLTHFLNRIWGTVKNKLYYSEPFALSWFKNVNIFPFENDLTMVAKDAGGKGLYVGTEKDTWFISGESIATLTAVKVGQGVIENTLSYGDFNGLTNIPIWTSFNGIFAGTSGELKKLTGRKLRYDAGAEGASFFREKDGEFQYGTIFTQPDIVVADAVSASIIKANTMFNSSFEEILRDGAQVIDSLSSSTS
jgi:hypothetical protein